MLFHFMCLFVLGFRIRVCLVSTSSVDRLNIWLQTKRYVISNSDLYSSTYFYCSCHSSVCQAPLAAAQPDYTLILFVISGENYIKTFSNLQLLHWKPPIQPYLKRLRKIINLNYGRLIKCRIQVSQYSDLTGRTFPHRMLSRSPQTCLQQIL